MCTALRDVPCTHPQQQPRQHWEVNYHAVNFPSVDVNIPGRDELERPGLGMELARGKHKLDWFFFAVG